MLVDIAQAFSSHLTDKGVFLNCIRGWMFGGGLCMKCEESVGVKERLTGMGER